MTASELENLLSEKVSQWAQFQNLMAISGELVKRRLRIEEDFWTTAHPVERKLFAVFAIAFIVGDNGLDLLFQQFRGSTLAIIECAHDGFREMGLDDHARALEKVIGLIERELKPVGHRFPITFDPLARAEYLEAERALFDDTDFFRKIHPVLKEAESTFRGSAETLTGPILRWIKQHRDALFPLLCG